MYMTPPAMGSRPQTPNNGSDSIHFEAQRDRLSVNIASAVPLQMQSPGYHPMTPTSSSPFSPYALYTGHSRSNSSSNSINQRSASPALSNASALTSVSSSASGPNTQAFAYTRQTVSSLPHPRAKQRKQRLFNVDRKAICLYHMENPNARQEDIALRYGVERSTISKILKCKTKWLNVPEDDGMRVAKHRYRCLRISVRSLLTHCLGRRNSLKSRTTWWYGSRSVSKTKFLSPTRRYETKPRRLPKSFTYLRRSSRRAPAGWKTSNIDMESVLASGRE